MRLLVVGQFDVLAPLIWPSVCATLFAMMPKRSRKESDPIKAALRVVEAATGGKLHPSRKNPAAVALGSLGGKKGGPARAAKLTAKLRKAIAIKAAKVRWAGHTKGSQE
jgi:hypothetical protein